MFGGLYFGQYAVGGDPEDVIVTGSFDLGSPSASIFVTVTVRVGGIAPGTPVSVEYDGPTPGVARV